MSSSVMSSSIIDVIAPMNEEGTKATVLRWGKKVGDAVREHEALLELETDKVTVEVASPASGELMEILKGPDEEVLPGQLLARVRSAMEAAAEAVENRSPGLPGVSSASVAEGCSDGAARLSPAVRRLLAKHELSAADIAGTGRDGRVTAQDVARHAAAASSTPAAARTANPIRIPHTPIRRRIAEHMLRSLTEAPHVTTLFEADLTRVLAHRARHRDAFERQGARLTLTAYFIAACARALRVHPQVNATFEEDALQLHADANIGVGTALGEGGLIVPVLQRAQELNLFGIALRLKELVAQARAGKLVPSEVRGGTFTISNHGVGGSLLAAPIVINQPQVAILGVGKVERRVCVVNTNDAEAIAVRSMCYVTLTIDHRAIDAFQANAFLSTVVATLQHWPLD
jgi:2-oxoglutarate dehydrogenase E2 component (dihydrolipoamide succinyltransferase)